MTLHRRAPTPIRAVLRAAALLAASLAATLTLALAPARALVEIDITDGNVQPLPIAITDMISSDGLGAQVTEVIAANLKRSGLFSPIDKAAFIEQISNPDVAPQFQSWTVLNAQALVTGRVVQEGGRIRAEYRLWDTFAGQQLDGQQFSTDAGNWRRVAHIISDAIYKRLTGEDGYFDSRVVFVDESGPKSARIKRLAIMDQDGANVRYLTNGNDLVLTPRFSPNRQEITYMSYGSGEPRVYLSQIETGQRELLGNFPGMTFAPRFSPDGARVVLSLNRDDGNADIFAVDLRSRSTQRLTNSNSINTSPSYSPDGGQIVFTSDRAGKAQIYVMGADGSGQNRISFGAGTYSTPVWSPRGDLIAFTKQTGGEFAIGVMRPDGSGERILTTGFLVEGPTWAPNGRVLMYFKEGAGSGGARLYSIDLSGRNEQRIPTPNFASDPAWSPLLQ